MQMNYKKFIYLFAVSIIIATLTSCQFKEVSVTEKKLSSETSNDSMNINNSLIENSQLCDFIEKDIDGDGKKDRIELLINKNFILKINNKEIILEKDKIYENALETEPKVYIINKQNAILISMIHKTNNIGSSIQLWIYDYKNNKLNQVIKINEANQSANYIISESNNGLSEISIPELNFNKKTKINTEFKGSYDNKGQIYISSHILFNIKDYNIDGNLELVTKRRISTGAIEWFPYYDILTFYKIEDTNLIPIKFVLLDTEIKYSIYEYIINKGSLHLNEFSSINTENIKESDLTKLLQDMIKEKVLIKKGQSYFFNIP